MGLGTAVLAGEQSLFRSPEQLAAQPGLTAASSKALVGEADLPGLVRKVPGPTPQQTISDFLALSERAEQDLRGALRMGLRQPGPFFSSDVTAQVERGVELLQQATQALDLSQIPQALRPMTGVASMLQLRSVLRYDLAHSSGLQIPGQQQVRSDHLQLWTMPGTPISLEAMTVAEARSGQACGQYSPGDFLFSRQTLALIPEDFSRIFDGDISLRRRFGADLYTYWALLPGGAIPPKWFFNLPLATRHSLLIRFSGQSLLQWLLLIPVTLASLLLVAWWLMRLREWRKRAADAGTVWPHLWPPLAVLPLLGLLTLWQWYAIDWINLIGPRQQAVLLGSRLLSGVLIALLLYQLAEATGQLICLQVRTGSDGLRRVSRRKGAGQIMTIARIFGLLAAVVEAVNTSQDLGVTSFTLLAVSSVPALALSLGTQQLIRDVSDGFSILLDGQIKPGDRCTIGTPKSGEIRGLVVSLGMRSMRLEQEDGSVMSLPNSQVASSVVTNHRFLTRQPWRLQVPIPREGVLPMQELLLRVRSLVAEVPGLEETRVGLDLHDGTWSLNLSGRWDLGVERDQREMAAEQLHLRLIEIISG